MTIDEVDRQAWTRKHDHPSFPAVPNAPRTLYPKSLEELIQICASRTPSERIRAAGSHCALSEAAISDSVFVETHDPNNVHQAMVRTLYDVVPLCLNPAFIDALANQVVPPFDQSNVGENQGLYGVAAPILTEVGRERTEVVRDRPPKEISSVAARHRDTHRVGERDPGFAYLTRLKYWCISGWRLEFR